MQMRKKPTFLEKSAYRDIVTSELTSRELSEKYNCSIKYVQHIKARYRDVGKLYPNHFIEWSEDDERLIARDRRPLTTVAVENGVGVDRIMRLRQKYKSRRGKPRSVPLPQMLEAKAEKNFAEIPQDFDLKPAVQVDLTMLSEVREIRNQLSQMIDHMTGLKAVLTRYIESAPKKPWWLILG